jgi:hypothetical protein
VWHSCKAAGRKETFRAAEGERSAASIAPAGPENWQAGKQEWGMGI